MFRSAVAASMAGALAFTLQGCGGSSPEFTMDCGGECSVTYSCSGGKASAGCTSGSALTLGKLMEGQTCDSYVRYMKFHYEDAEVKKDECDKITAPPPPTEYVLDCGGECSVTFSCGSDLIKQGKVSPGCTTPEYLSDKPEKASDEDDCSSYPGLKKTIYEESGPTFKANQCALLKEEQPSASDVATVIDDSNTARGSSASRSASAPSSLLEKVLYMALGGAIAVAVLLLFRAISAAFHSPRQARDAKATDPIELVQVQQPSSATAGVP